MENKRIPLIKDAIRVSRYKEGNQGESSLGFIENDGIKYNIERTSSNLTYDSNTRDKIKEFAKAYLDITDAGTEKGIIPTEITFEIKVRFSRNSSGLEVEVQE